jgi:hypothetical protein
MPRLFTLRFALLAALSVLGLVLVGVVILFVLPRPEYQLLGLIDDYPASSRPYDLHQAGGYYLVNTGAELLAINPNAPRKAGCRVFWDEARDRFSDPCFGTIFNLTGEYVDGPPSPPLGRYLVRIEDERIWVSTDALFTK